MSKLAVIYWSMTGNTEAMAQAVADGAKEAGADVSLFRSRTLPPPKPPATTCWPWLPRHGGRSAGGVGV